MSQSSYQIKLKAVDQTASGFASVQARAAAASKKLSSMMGAAVAAVGAYAGFREIVSSINELGKLSDIAQKTSLSVDELTSATSAFQILGVKTDIDSLAKSFQYMEKTTGRTGMEGFYETLQDLGKIEDTSERAKAAMEVFGRSGMELMPLINAADTSVDALQGVVAAMPAIPQAAANAGDDAADAMLIANNGIKSVWMQGIGAICGWFGNNFTGGIRGAAAEAANYLEYYAKVGVTKAMHYWEKITTFFEAIGTFWGTFVGNVTEGASWGDAWEAAKSAYDDESEMRENYLQEEKRIDDERIAAWTQAFEEKEAVIEKLGDKYNKAVESTASRRARDLAALEGNESAAQREAAIKNALMLGGSNQGNALAALGPQFQNETKKQTSILEKIAKNTEITANKDSDSTMETDI